MLRSEIIINNGIIRPNIHNTTIYKHIIKIDNIIRPISIVRAGIILYNYDIVGNLYFYLGVDYESGEYTDFGGGIKKNENIIDGALREYNEESLNVLKLTYDNLINCNMYYNTNMAIIFVQYDFDYTLIRNNFLKHSLSDNLELKDIIKIDYNSVINYLYTTNIFYKKVKTFILEILKQHKYII